MYYLLWKDLLIVFFVGMKLPHINLFLLICQEDELRLILENESMEEGK